jgi:toxin ParE1/3/4
MRLRRIVYRRHAREDIFRLGQWLTMQVGRSFSRNYLKRIRGRIDSLSYGSERGSIREEVGAGVRVIGIMGPISVAFVVTGETVVILRVLYRGQDWHTTLAPDDPD